MKENVPHPCGNCKMNPDYCNGKACERWIDWFYKKWNEVCEPLRRKEKEDE